MRTSVTGLSRPPEVTVKADGVAVVRERVSSKERVIARPSFEVAADWNRGLLVSTVRVTVLLLSEPSLLVSPVELEKTPDATEITPSEVLLAVGVKVAE